MDNNVNYFRDRGYAGGLGFGKRSAILIVDLINAFTKKHSPLACNIGNVLEVNNSLINTARRYHVPIIFTTTCYNHITECGLWIKKIKGIENLKNKTEDVEIDSRLEFDNNHDTLLEKRYASAFFGTALCSQLISQHIDTLIVTGASTSGCVRATVVDAIQYGFRPIIVADAVCDRSDIAARQAIIDIETKYGDVKKATDIIDYWNS